MERKTIQKNMKRKVVRWTGGILAGVLLCIPCVPLKAATLEVEPISIMGEGTVIQLKSAAAYGNAGLSIASGKATATCSVRGGANVTKITAAMKLQKKNSSGKWVTVSSWSGKTGQAYLRMSRSASVAKGTYRTYVYATVYKNGKTEVSKYYSTARKY